MTEPGDIAAGRLQRALFPDRFRVANEAAWRFALTAAFPHLSHLAHWPARLRPRGAAAFLVYRVAIGLAVGALIHVFGRQAAAVGDLRAELGREPTPPEIAERLGWDPPECPR